MTPAEGLWEGRIAVATALLGLGSTSLGLHPLHFVQPALEVVHPVSPALGPPATPSAGLRGQRTDDAREVEDDEPPGEHVPRRGEDTLAFDQLQEWSRSDGQDGESAGEHEHEEGEPGAVGQREHPAGRAVLAVQRIDRAAKLIVAEEIGRRVIGALRREVRNCATWTQGRAFPGGDHFLHHHGFL